MANFVFLWPMLFALIAVGDLFLTDNQKPLTWAGVAILSLAALPGLLLIPPMAYSVAVGLVIVISLTGASIENGVFKFWIEIPLALGTVGGLTRLHPLVNLALKILQDPSAKELMEITAVAGLAQNFAAMRSLVTTGIQQGHMKMHLLNILNQMGADENEKKTLVEYFKRNAATHGAVVEALQKLRQD